MGRHCKGGQILWLSAAQEFVSVGATFFWSADVRKLSPGTGAEVSNTYEFAHYRLPRCCRGPLRARLA
jgi:hypothetical protein